MYSHESYYWLWRYIVDELIIYLIHFDFRDYRAVVGDQSDIYVWRMYLIFYSFNFLIVSKQPYIVKSIVKVLNVSLFITFKTYLLCNDVLQVIDSKRKIWNLDKISYEKKFTNCTDYDSQINREPPVLLYFKRNIPQMLFKSHILYFT